MPRNVRQHIDTPPDDRLGRIAGHPEYRDGDQAILLIRDRVGGITATHEYEKAGGVVMDLLEHAQAIAEANDVPFAVMEMEHPPGGQG